MLTIKTVDDRIFVLQSESASEIAGMLIPESERKKVCRGIVALVGPGWLNKGTGERVPMTVKLGDEVGYSEHSATTVEVDGVEYQVVKEPDLLYIK